MASWLTEHSGLTISVPDAEYSDRPIPHFTHSGTGYQLLDNLGKAFGVMDYVWYLLPDGGVYVGGAEKALFANDSGMFQFPPEGTLVEIAFTGGRPDKPFVRQTVPEGTSLPDIQAGEQLQQQRAEVSQRVTQAGDWVRQTDQTISETSMVRMVKADSEQRELVSRETTIKATDK